MFFRHAVSVIYSSVYSVIFCWPAEPGPGRGARPDKVDPTLGDSGFFKVWNRIIVDIRKNDPKTSRAFLSVT